MNNWAENQVTKMPSTGVPGIKRRLAALIYRALALPFVVLDLGRQCLCIAVVEYRATYQLDE